MITTGIDNIRLLFGSDLEMLEDVAGKMPILNITDWWWDGNSDFFIIYIINLKAVENFYSRLVTIKYINNMIKCKNILIA